MWPFIFGTLFLVSVLSPLPLAIWAWVREQRKIEPLPKTGPRRVLGWTALWLVTGQLLASLVVLAIVLPRYEFPQDIHIWVTWCRIVLIITPVVLVLSVIGQTRARVQILLCSLAVSTACVLLATLA